MVDDAAKAQALAAFNVIDTSKMTEAELKAHVVAKVLTLECQEPSLTAFVTGDGIGRGR